MPGEIDIKKENLRNWLKDKYNFVFLTIFIVAIAIRIYYFILTKDQPMWWDEADYMAYSKTLAGFTSHWAITGGHVSIFPYVAALFFKIGLSDVAIRFFLELIPSIAVLFMVYKICLLMYQDKRIAIICLVVIATLWEFLFNTFRFHVDNPALLFAFLAIYVFWQGFERKEKIFGKISANWAIPLTVAFSVIAYSLRRGYFLFFLFFLVYALMTRKVKDLIKDKYNWIAAGVFFALVAVFEFTVSTQLITQTSQQYFHPEKPISLLMFQVFGAYFKPVEYAWSGILFYLFWIGLVLIVYSLALHFGYFKKTENPKFRSDLFAFLTLFITLAYFIFYQRDTELGDLRWYFPLLFGAMICIARGAVFITNFLKKYNRTLAIIIFILMIGYGGYYEMVQADSIIKNKIPSFDGIKQASLYLKGISAPSDIIISMARPQPAYYAERKTVHLEGIIGKFSPEVTREEFLSALQKNESLKYLIVTFSEPNYPDWLRQVAYYQDPNSANTLMQWRIPLMNTTLDNYNQDIKKSMTYGNIEFKFLTAIDDAFVYEIIRL